MVKQSVEKDLSLLDKIKQLLSGRLGINSGVVSESCWRRALAERMAATGAATATHYYNLLASDGAEFYRFIEYILIPETWFFRDAAALWHCAEAVAAGAGAAHILVLPCSSGEEAYSLAIALHEKKAPAHRYSIEAIDISESLLNKAAQALYGKNSFRGKEAPLFLHKYFIPQDGGYRLVDEIRRLTLFHQGNAIESPWYMKVASYDYIFCRNLLIYLTEEAQKKLLAALKLALKENGLLFVGPSEIEVAGAGGFVCVDDVKLCALKKKQPAADLNGQAIGRRGATLNVTGFQAAPVAARTPAVSFGAVESLENKLRRAKLLADEGSFGEALRLCRQTLADDEGLADAYFLIGVIYHAQEQFDKAEEHFEKALALEPTHYETLVYLALLMDKKGLYQRGSSLRAKASQSNHRSAIMY